MDKGQKAAQAFSMLPPKLQAIARNSVDFPGLEVNHMGVWKRKGAHLVNKVTPASALKFQDLRKGFMGWSWKNHGAHLTSRAVGAEDIRFQQLKKGLMGLGEFAISNQWLLFGGVAAASWFLFIKKK